MATRIYQNPQNWYKEFNVHIQVENMVLRVVFNDQYLECGSYRDR